MKNKISVLLLDDNSDVIELYKKQIEGDEQQFNVIVETDGYKAYLVAHRQLFDLVIIDAKLDYKGFEFGGLRLADDLYPRYGNNSILIISRYITKATMQQYEYNYRFLEKPSGGEGRAFAKEIRSNIKRMHKLQYAFVAMPFSSDLSSIYENHIKPGVEDAGYKCVRVDKITHTGSIHTMIFDLVRRSKLVIFLADTRNPNAYYEAGFADAMKKELLIIVNSLDELMFDVRYRNTIVYGENIGELRRSIKEMVVGLRTEAPIVI